jgi:hypothetical protein
MSHLSAAQDPAHALTSPSLEALSSPPHSSMMAADTSSEIFYPHQPRASAEDKVASSSE